MIRPIRKGITRTFIVAAGLSGFAGGAWPQTPPGTVSTLYRFKGAPDGSNPEAGLVADSNGVLYGATANGGLPATVEWWVTDGCGVVFSLTPPSSPGGEWTESVLYRFTGGSDGCGPSGGLAIGSGGVLYGTTSNGAAAGADGLPLGTVYSLTPPSASGGSWTEAVIHTFYGCPGDAAPPLFGVVLGEGGALYGAGFYGGANSCLPSDNAAGEGAVFELTPPASPGGVWTESLMYSIGDLNDGPATNLTLGHGVLYGTTVYGGGAYGGPGTVFSLTPPSSPGGSWTETVLSNFTTSDGKNNGSRPGAPVAIGPGGVLYGTTSGGGVGGGGEVYSLTPPGTAGGTWTYTVLRDFSSTKGNPVGDGPQQLTLTPHAIFTACAHGGASHAGTVIALTPPATAGESWNEKIVHTFDGADGVWPNGGLLIGQDGLMYGTTFGREPVEAGGGPRYGTVYSLQP